MAGFGSRERIGLIALGIVVVAAVALGPAADHLGCTRRDSLPATTAAPVAADTATLTAAPPDTLHSSTSRRSSRDTTRTRRRRTTRRPHSPAPVVTPRSPLDEPIGRGGARGPAPNGAFGAGV
ncbi:MAG: hypothetical protein K2I37_02545 [Muribaculaceae bacterium]|nr:hypothetical protein [Muribaculaceae bacterium]